MTAINQQNAHDDGDTVDIGELLRIVLNNWKLVVACVVAAIICAVLYLRVTSSVYSVDGLVQIDSGQSSADALLNSSGLSGLSSLANVKSPADTEIQLFKSRFVLGSVIRNLNLDIAVTSDHSRWYRRLLTPVSTRVDYKKDGVSYTSKDLAFQIVKFDVPEALFNHSFELTVFEDGRYEIDLLNKSNISDFASQPKVTGRIGQMLRQPFGEGVLQILINKGSRNLGSGSVYLTKKSLLLAVQDINANLSIAEKGKQTGVLSLVYQGVDPSDLKQTLNEIMRVYLAQNVASRTEETQRTLSFLDQQLPFLRKELESSENKYNDFREKNNTIDPTKEAELLLVQSVELKTKKVELEQQGALLGQKYTANFPMISQLNAQIKALDQEGKELDGRIVAMPDIQRQYLQLYRDVQVNTVIYTTLLNSYEQLKVLKAGKTATVRILDQAEKSSQPIKPKKALVLLLALVLGGLVSLVLIVLKNILYSGIKESEQIESGTGVSVVATIPHSAVQRKMFNGKSKKVSLIAKDDVDDLAIESLKSLRTTIHFAAMKASNNIILITGPSPEIGKSFISANFAAVCAQMGKSVILVDADMRRGHLNKYFNLEKTKGLAEYLKDDQLSLDDVCFSTSVDGLSVIPKGSAPVNPAELLLTERFNHLMSDLSAKYDYVIIDSPPILAATDAAIIGRMAGMTLMVVRYGQTHMRELEWSLSRLSQAGVSVEGIVFNDVQSAIGYGYGYQYAYQYRADK